MEKIDRSITWQWLAELTQWVIDQAINIQQIPAPTFQETRRADYVAEQFKALGLDPVECDAVNNVYGLLPGKDAALPALMIVAHTDTVFHQEIDLSIRRETDTIYGPGLGDNSIGVAGMLGAIKMLELEKIRPERSIWFVATAREEGLGDLGGMKIAFERLRPDIHAVINLEGLAFGHIYHAGIAVRRLRITATTPGGHSWLHFGRPSAIHGIIDLGARITAIKLPETPRTTYNIGMIDGGQSINSIASSANLWLDMRSERRESLEALEASVREQIAHATQDDLSFSVEVVGDRPAGYLAPDHWLVQKAMAALEQVGVRGSLETGSTDGNVSLAADCPTVTIGITRGGNAHRLDEYIETGPVASGLQQMIILILAALNAK